MRMILFTWKLQKKNKKYVLGVIYRSPKQSEENDIKLYNEIKSIIKDKNAVISATSITPP